MPSTTVQSLSRATTATFEELALLFPEHELSPEKAAAPLDVAVSVELRGPHRERLVLRASSNILSSIAGVVTVFHLSAPHVHEGVDIVSRDDDTSSARVQASCAS